jgi:RNA polymerase sigma factor (sigma-70 family)
MEPEDWPMALTITHHLIRSADTQHTAGLGDGGGTVTWLPGRVLTGGRAAAIETAGAASQIPADCRSTAASRSRCTTPLGEDGDSEFGDLIEDSEAIQPGEAVSFTLLQEQLHSVLGTLPERDAGVVSMRFGLTDGQPRTLDEIGKVYGVTRERIRQIESKTMSKLRHTSRSDVLRDYLD